MTTARPMPGPPGGFTDRARLNYALIGKQITHEQYQEFDNALTLAFTARPKRLTDAECAAEYWRASYHLARPLAANTFVPTPEWDRTRQEAATWFRFATTPHEGSPQ